MKATEVIALMQARVAEHGDAHVVMEAHDPYSAQRHYLVLGVDKGKYDAPGADSEAPADGETVFVL